MEWFKKHTDTVMVISAVATSMLWMNGKFNEIDKQFSSIEREIAVMKAVLIIKNIMPCELAQCNEEKK